MKKASDKIFRYQMRGMLIPFAANGPVFLKVNNETILPIFSSREKFDDAAKWGKFEFAAKNMILDPETFKKSVLLYKKKFPFEVGADPHITPEGNTQFHMIPFEEEENG